MKTMSRPAGIRRNVVEASPLISLSRSLFIPTLPKWLKWLAAGGLTCPPPSPPSPFPSDYRTTADAIMLSQFTHFYLKVCSTQQTHTHAPALRITLTPIWFLPIFLSLPLSHSLTNTHTLMLLSLITSSTTTPCYSLALCVSLLSLNRHNLKQIKLAHSRRLDCLCVSSGVFAAKWLKTCPP